MTKQNEAARSDAPAKRAEAKDDPNFKEFIAHARKIADAAGKASEERMHAQDQYDRVNRELVQNRQTGE